jgi:hypothetical protein
MKRVCLSVAILLSVLTLVACADKASSSNPTAPTTPTPNPTPAATVRAVVVTSTPTSPTSFQMHARADMSDGSSREVTMLSKWETSNPTIAAVSSAGVITVLGSGQVEVRATYENVAGTIGLLVSGPARPSTFAITGVAIEVLPSGKVLPGVTIMVTEGPNAGLSTTTDEGGLYRFAALQTAPLTLEARKGGYLLWRIMNLTLDRDRQIQIVMFPTPPKNADGVDATARCNDSTWSWAQKRDEACAANGGIAYAVCPGPFCELANRAR